MKSPGCAVLFIMAALIMSYAPESVWMGGLVILGIVFLKAVSRALAEGREPPTLSEAIENLFGGKDQ
jgi:hypothetical protein